MPAATQATRGAGPAPQVGAGTLRGAASPRADSRIGLGARRARRQASAAAAPASRQEAPGIRAAAAEPPVGADDAAKPESRMVSSSLLSVCSILVTARCGGSTFFFIAR